MLAVSLVFCVLQLFTFGFFCKKCKYHRTLIALILFIATRNLLRLISLSIVSHFCRQNNVKIINFFSHSISLDSCRLDNLDHKFIIMLPIDRVYSLYRQHALCVSCACRLENFSNFKKFNRKLGNVHHDVHWTSFCHRKYNHVVADDENLFK